ncbi:hypothetical protein ACVGWU_21240, partial [Enterobacter intestinihominis]
MIFACGGLGYVFKRKQWTAALQEYLGVRQVGDAALTRAGGERLALQFMPEEVIRLLERSGK